MSLLGIGNTTGGTAPEHMDDPRAVGQELPDLDEVFVCGMFYVSIRDGEPDPRTVFVTHVDELVHDITAGTGTPWDVTRAVFAWYASFEVEPTKGAQAPVEIGELIVQEYANRIAEQAREVA